MQYPALAIANYLIDKATMSGEVLDHLKIQKLVYMAHGWNLAIFDTPLIDEPVQAWKYGPVISSLYHQFKKYGNGDVEENGVLVTGNGGFSVPNIAHDDKETRELLDKVWQAYNKYTGVQLSNLTHLEGTPWAKTWKRGTGKKYLKIGDRVMTEHFRGLVQHD